MTARLDPRFRKALSIAKKELGPERFVKRRRRLLVCPRCRPNRLARRLVVLQRKCNHSAFSGYRFTPSDYSGVACLRCGYHWRTRADVSSIPDWKGEAFPGEIRSLDRGIPSDARRLSRSRRSPARPRPPAR